MTLRLYFKTGVFILFVLFVAACKSYYPLQSTATLTKVSASVPEDTSITNYYRPYKDALDKSMKIQVAELEEDLTKKLPESTLGNLMADIFKIETQKYTHDSVDVAIVNYGGIRIPSLTKGPLNIEHAYLLMPFDNYLVELVLTGQQLSDFCDSIALKKGWPISGMTFQIKNNKAIHILVSGQPIDLAKNYKVAVSDYIANGGDGMTFLRTIPHKETGKLYRDAIIEYWQEQTQAHKKISAKLENRISYAE